MADRFADRVKDTTTTTGTGDLTLAGAPPSGYQAFATAFATGQRIAYCVVGGAEWEVGLGTLSAATTLARTQPWAGSAAVPVALSAGTKDVFCTGDANAMNDALPRGRAVALRAALP